MAEQKIFAGPRIRRVRTNLGLTQATMAEQLGISPSYLNLIERNQRPLTVQLLLKLSTTYEIDLRELQGDESGKATDALKEIFSDPLLANEVASDSELVEVADSAPNVISGMIKLYSAYKESMDKLSSLSDLMSDEAKAKVVSSSRLPMDEVRDYFRDRAYYFEELDQLASQAGEEMVRSDEPIINLRNTILDEMRVTTKILPEHAMQDHAIRYDRHSQRIFLSERLTPEERLIFLASQFALLAHGDKLQDFVSELKFENAESERLMKLELAYYFGLCMLMPYDEFYTAVARTRYDIGLLSRRYHLRWRDVVRRICSLKQPKRAGIPFFMIEMDPVGNICSFTPGAQFSLPRTGNPCIKLLPTGVHSNHGRIAVESVSLPDGPEWLIIAHYEKTRAFGHGDRPRRRTIILGCDPIYSKDIIYGDGFLEASPISIGVSCRLCEIPNCRDRAFPPVTRPTVQDLTVRSFSDYDFG